MRTGTALAILLVEPVGAVVGSVELASEGETQSVVAVHPAWWLPARPPWPPLAFKGYFALSCLSAPSSSLPPLAFFVVLEESSAL